MISEAINFEASTSTSSFVAEESSVREKQKTIIADSDIVLDDATTTMMSDVPKIPEYGHVSIDNSNFETAQVTTTTNNTNIAMTQELSAQKIGSAVFNMTHSNITIHINNGNQTL